jgi:hypothetical protein
MDEPIEAYTSVETADEFWLSLGAVLTDEVVIVEAVASGMDWPDFEAGRRRLAATRRRIVGAAVSSGWIGSPEAELLAHEDPNLALAAARPWIEREQERAFGDTRDPEAR